MSSLKYLQDKGLIDENSETLTITKENGDSYELTEVIDEIIEIETKDLKLRNVAEISNIKKRQASQLTTIKADSTYKALLEIIELHDNFHQSSKMLSPDQLELIKPFYDKVNSILSKNGISEINPTEYNPDQQEVVSVVPSSTKEINVVSKGYKMGDRILRYPKVILFTDD